MKVVLLDDSRTVLMTLQLLLEEKGISKEEIFPFSQGENALGFIKEQGANLIFTDIQMPGMDGFEFTQKLFELSSNFIPSLIVVSADDNTNETLRMKSIGAKHFIKKPIDFDHFNEFILPFLGKQFQSNSTEKLNSDSVIIEKTFTGSIDYEAIAQSMGIGVKHIPKLLNSFVSESLIQLEHLKAALSEFDYEQIERSAHSIKGSAGNMKFDLIYKTAKLTEIAAHLKDDSYDYLANYIKLQSEIELIAYQLKGVSP